MVITSAVTGFGHTTVPHYPGTKFPWAGDSRAGQQQSPKAALLKVSSIPGPARRWGAQGQSGGGGLQASSLQLPPPHALLCLCPPGGSPNLIPGSLRTWRPRKRIPDMQVIHGAGTAQGNLSFLANTLHQICLSGSLGTVCPRESTAPASPRPLPALFPPGNLPPPCLQAPAPFGSAPAEERRRQSRAEAGGRQLRRTEQPVAKRLGKSRGFFVPAPLPSPGGLPGREQPFLSWCSLPLTLFLSLFRRRFQEIRHMKILIP